MENMGKSEENMGTVGCCLTKQPGLPRPHENMHTMPGQVISR